MAGTGQKHIPTMYDIAVLASVSVATVSHVINPDSEKYVSDELRQKVLNAARDLGYRLNSLARGMRGKRRRTIAILVPQFENIFFTRMVMAAEQVAYDAGYVLLICSTYDNTERERVYIENLLSQQVDGFLIAPTINGTANTEPLRELRIPSVILDRQLVGVNLSSYNYIGFDNRLGAEIATQELIDRGHQRIGFIGWCSNIQQVNERCAGFRDTLVRNNLDLGSCPILLGDHSRENGERLMMELLKNHTVTAAFIGHQYLGEGAILALQRLKKMIPRDLSVIIYGRPVWTELTYPSLVCIQMPDQEIGKPAAQMLIEEIERGSALPQQIILAPELSSGDSITDLSTCSLIKQAIRCGG